MQSMKLLIITQKIDKNDPVLGFFCRWVEEFARHCKVVTVICLEKGKYSFSENVKVLSLGKESGRSKIKYILNFYRHIWKERKNYNSVFVHMNQIYVILGYLVWKALNKKIGLWYAHGHVSFSLKIAEKLSDIIFTSTKNGFRLKSEKVKIVGQGIDTDFFKPLKNKPKNKIFKIITIGRISPIKDYETLINAIEILKNKDIKFSVEIIGSPGTLKQEQYFQKIKNVVNDKKLNNFIYFLGPKSNREILRYLQRADLFVNMSRTGSLDKAILEAMAVELPILTCNESLSEVLGDKKNIFVYEKGDFKSLSNKIIYFIDLHKKYFVFQNLRSLVVGKHSLGGFILRILKHL